MGIITNSHSSQNWTCSLLLNLYDLLRTSNFVWVYLFMVNSWIHTSPNGISMIWNANSLIQDFWTWVTMSALYETITIMAWVYNLYTIDFKKIYRKFLILIIDTLIL